MGGSSPSSTTTTVKNELPPEVRKYVDPLLSTGWGLAQQPYNPYPGMTLAPLTPEQQTAMYMGTQRAVQGSGVGNAAQNMATQTLQGNYFDNPYLSDAIRLAQEEQIPQLGYMSQAGGSFGNSGINEAAVRNLGNIATSMRYQNYSGERDRQMQAAQLAPQLGAMDYEDVKMLLGLGDARRAYQQELLDESRGKWEAAQQWPYSQTDWFANLFRGAGYGTGTGTTTTTAPNPYQSNALANYVGGGMALGGLYDVLSKMGS